MADYKMKSKLRDRDEEISRLKQIIDGLQVPHDGLQVPRGSLQVRHDGQVPHGGLQVPHGGQVPHSNLQDPGLAGSAPSPTYDEEEILSNIVIVKEDI